MINVFYKISNWCSDLLYISLFFFFHFFLLRIKVDGTNLTKTKKVIQIHVALSAYLNFHISNKQLNNPTFIN